MHRPSDHARGVFRCSGIVALGVFLMLLSGLRIRAFAQVPGSPHSAGEKARSEVESARAARRANARPVIFVAPFSSVANGDESSVVLLNRFSDPLVVHIDALAESGDRHSVGDYVVPPAQHVEVPLASLPTRPAFKTASVSLAFAGDADMLQGWVVVRRGQDVEEFPILAVGNSGDTNLISYWAVDAIHRPSSPVYYLFNAGSQATHVDIHLYPGRENKNAPGKLLSRTIGPGKRTTFSPLEVAPDLQAGRITFSHDGSPGSLMITGVLEGSETLVALPIVESSQLGIPSEYYGLRLPVRDPIDGSPVQSALVVFNPDGLTESAQISILEQSTGGVVATLQARLEPGQIRVLDMTQSTGSLWRSSESELGLKVAAAGRLHVWGVVEFAGGGVKSVAFMAKSSSHGSGMYPLPSIDLFDVVTVFSDVGTEPSRLVAQISWETGAYSLPPIELLPGQGFRLNLSELVRTSSPDLLGRRLDPAFRHGFLHWKTQSGSVDILARTEVRPWNLRDSFGFNCQPTCCPDSSYGSITPPNVNFDIGQTPAFQACETFVTCSETMGPFPVATNRRTYTAPLSWNGSSIASTGLTLQTVFFSATGQRTLPGSGGLCTEVDFPIFGSAPVEVDKCQKDNAPGIDPTKGCAQQTATCQSCQDCCTKNRQAADCRCEKVGGVGVQACKAGTMIAEQKCKLEGCQSLCIE